MTLYVVLVVLVLCVVGGLFFIGRRLRLDRLGWRFWMLALAPLVVFVLGFIVIECFVLSENEGEVSSWQEEALIESRDSMLIQQEYDEVIDSLNFYPGEAADLIENN